MNLFPGEAWRRNARGTSSLLGGSAGGIQPPFEPVELDKMRRAEKWLLESPGRAKASAGRVKTILGETQAGEASWTAEKRERRIRETPYHEFMAPGPEREAAAARGGWPSRGASARAGEVRRAAASVGRDVDKTHTGEIERFVGVTEKGVTEEDRRVRAERVARGRAFLLGGTQGQRQLAAGKPVTGKVRPKRRRA